VDVVVEVPLNTVIADLDEALRVLLRTDLERHGFEGVEIAFDAPSKEWSGKLTRPTVDLFLYDLRESLDRAHVSATERRGNGAATVAPPPLHLELTYAVTAWTKAVEDEHRLLSQVLAILFSHKSLPEHALAGRPEASRLGEVKTLVGRPREEKADFWTSVGGEYKASIDFVAHVTVESGARFVRGPEVRTQTIRTRMVGAPPATTTELHRFGGTVHDPEGGPVADAWVILPAAGLWTATDADGRFRFARVALGDHRVLVRTQAGEQAEASVTVPGEPAEVVVGRKRRAAARK
jgi:Pvc16 N-terminal domain